MKNPMFRGPNSEARFIFVQAGSLKQGFNAIESFDYMKCLVPVDNLFEIAFTRESFDRHDSQKPAITKFYREYLQEIIDENPQQYRINKENGGPTEAYVNLASAKRSLALANAPHLTMPNYLYPGIYPKDLDKFPSYGIKAKAQSGMHYLTHKTTQDLVDFFTETTKIDYNGIKAINLAKNSSNAAGDKKSDAWGDNGTTRDGKSVTKISTKTAETTKTEKSSTKTGQNRKIVTKTGNKIAETTKTVQDAKIVAKIDTKTAEAVKNEKIKIKSGTKTLKDGKNGTKTDNHCPDNGIEAAGPSASPSSLAPKKKEDDNENDFVMIEKEPDEEYEFIYMADLAGYAP